VSRLYARQQTVFVATDVGQQFDVGTVAGEKDRARLAPGAESAGNRMAGGWVYTFINACDTMSASRSLPGSR
jgi:hypothetical protein